LKEATSLISKDAQPERFDVVIVGSGPAGSAVARDLRDRSPEARILMVEAGPQVSSPRGRHIKTITDSGERLLAQTLSQGPQRVEFEPLMGPPISSGGRIPQRPGLFLVGDAGEDSAESGMPAAAMSSNVGGMGAHWSCACPYPGEGELIPFLPKEEFESDFNRASELLCVTSAAFESAPLSTELRQVLSQAYDEGRSTERRVQPMPLAIQTDSSSHYWAGTDVVLGDLVEDTRGTFELRAETLAERIIHDNGNAEGVQLRNLATGESYTVSAGYVVVAADALRSPQLLFASAIRPAALGKYLNDQPQVVALVKLRDDVIARQKSVAKQTGGQVQQFSGVTWIPFDKDRFPFHGQIVQMDASPIHIDTADVWPGSIVGVGLFGCKDVRAEDRVELSESEVDYLGMPRISIRYSLTDIDRNTISSMILEAEKITSIIGSPLGGGPVELAAGSSLHYQGSVRMGPANDGTSVCDPEGRVWDTQNVFVAGNGVIPTPTACNPTATAIALAMRTSRSLAERLADVKTASKVS
jgi:pyranose oxidase